MSKASDLMKTAQVEKTRQTVQRLLEWFSSKEQFYKQYLPIQQAIIANAIAAAEMTIERLKNMAQMVRQEKEYQTYHYEKCQKNILSNAAHFGPQFKQSTDSKGSKIKVELPSWSSNVDRIFVSLGKQQQGKQAQIKKIYKTLDTIQEAFNKEQQRYKGEIKKYEKDFAQLFDKIDSDEKEQTKLVAKLLKQSKNKGSELKDSYFFISELKKVELSVLNELSSFAERGNKLVQFIKVIIKLEKEVAKTVKQHMNQFLNYRVTLLGHENKGQDQIYGYLALCEDKVDQQRLAYFNKVMLAPNQVQSLQQLLKEDCKNSWQAIVKFLQKPSIFFNESIKASHVMEQLFKNISYRCWLSISLAQGWFIQSYTPSVMYMTYDSTMIIYSKEGECLKKIHTSASKINKIEGNTVFLQEKIKGFFSDSIEEYKVRFENIERLEEFQLFMENQIK